MTMRSIKVNKGKWGILLLLALFSLFLGYLILPSSSEKAELQVFPTDEGWGYQVVVNAKVLIYQPTIPAIPANQSFPTEKSAREAGRLVMKKMKAGKDFSLSTEEVRSVLARQ